MEAGFDPLEKAKMTTKAVCRGDHRKYYRFRPAKFANLFVRVSLKGCSGSEYSALSGASSDGFYLQVQALENLVRAGVKTHPAVMISFSTPDTIAVQRKRLRMIDRSFENIEVEELALYGDVAERLEKANLSVTHGRYSNI